MIIHEPAIRQRDGNVRLSARVEFETPDVDVPDTVWFDVPERYADMLSDRADGFAISLQSLAMLHNEPLTVRGALSPRLHYGLQQAQNAFQFFNPRTMHRVDIHADNLTEAEARPGRGVSTLFSGGIDSTYSVWRHLPQNQPLPQYQLTHAFFVHGFDISLHKKDRFNAFYERYRRLLQSVGVDLIPVRTNIRDMFMPIYRHRPQPEGMTYNTAFPAMGLLFSRGIHTHYVPSSIDLSVVESIATHPGIEYTYSTEAFTMFHDSSDKSRTQKLDAITGWQDALDELRVCIRWIPAGDLTSNCCRCYKCVAAMIRLDLTDSLHLSPTFPHRLKTRHIYRAALSVRFIDPPFYRDAIARAARKRQWGLYAHLQLARRIYHMQLMWNQRSLGSFAPQKAAP